MPYLEMTLVLAGGRRGQTCTLGKFRFTNGAIVLRGDDRTVLGRAKYLGRVYAAFPQGSKELETYGRGNVPAGDGNGQAVSGDGQPGQPGSSPPSADNGSGTTGAASGSGSDVPNAGSGHGNARLDRIKEAVTALDHTNDDHWTGTGLPRVDVISTAVGDPTVSRRDVEQAAPGFTRTVK